MARVRFIQPDRSERTVELSGEVTVMLAAVRNGIRGIEGECGGCLDCATCHVYVEETQAALLTAPSADEAELLSSISGQRKPNSRLGCQVKVPSVISELVVFVPEAQL